MSIWISNDAGNLNIQQEMEQERQARENEEKERAERMKKIKEQFADPNSEWENDKTDIQKIAMQEKERGQLSEEDEGKSLKSSGSVQAQVQEAAPAQ
jgi:mannan polymerase II complex ANP1 subunit